MQEKVFKTGVRWRLLGVLESLFQRALEHVVVFDRAASLCDSPVRKATGKRERDNGSKQVFENGSEIHNAVSKYSLRLAVNAGSTIQAQSHPVDAGCADFIDKQQHFMGQPLRTRPEALRKFCLQLPLPSRMTTESNDHLPSDLVFRGTAWALNVDGCVIAEKVVEPVFPTAEDGQDLVESAAAVKAEAAGF